MFLPGLTRVQIENLEKTKFVNSAMKKVFLTAGSNSCASKKQFVYVVFISAL
jgi:hypothetical protein